MKVVLKYDTVGKMLELCKEVKEGRVEVERLNQLLEHPDYQTEFTRYRGRITKEEFSQFVQSIMHSTQDEQANPGLKARYALFREMMENIEYYIEEAQKIAHYRPEDFQEEAKIALAGLPDGLDLGDINILFTVGIGVSFGWVYENKMHFDVLYLIKEGRLGQAFSAIAHELHHIGYEKYCDSLDIENVSIEGRFYLSFGGEGLAVKYCNFAEGILSRSLNPGKKNRGLDPDSWAYLNNDFEATFETFKEQIRMIRSGELKELNDLTPLFTNYWWNPWKEGQDRSEIPALLQSRVYSFGNEIWGVIHDAFGKEKVYDVIRNLQEFPQVYNAAVVKIGKGEYQI